MQRRGHGEIAGFFGRLESEAALQRTKLEDWLRDLANAGRAARAPDQCVPAPSDDAAEDLDPDIATPYQALATAVRSAEEAFRYYSHFASSAEGETVRAQAEALAKEALTHAALLRRERRRAYRSQLHHPASILLPAPSLVETLADLLFAACAIEREIESCLTAVASRQLDLEPLCEAVRDNNKVLEKESLAADRPQHALDQFFQQHPTAQMRQGEGRATVAGSLERALAESKRAFAFYDAVVADASKEAVMLKAQSLSETALSRIAILAGALTS
jgi:rubrerythrin